MLNDLRYAIRMLLKNRGFTSVAVLTLALGIGANAAIFTAVNAALLRPLPYREPERLVHLWETSQQQEFGQREASYPDYLDWRDQNHVFEQVAGYSWGGLAFTGRGTPEQVRVAVVTLNFFSTLGVEAIVGRTFFVEEQRRSPLPTGSRQGSLTGAILSYRFWQHRFGADPNLIGQVLTVGGDNYIAVGVLPANFHFFQSGIGRLVGTPQPDPLGHNQALPALDRRDRSTQAGGEFHAGPGGDGHHCPTRGKGTPGIT